MIQTVVDAKNLKFTRLDVCRIFCFEIGFDSVVSGGDQEAIPPSPRLDIFLRKWNLDILVVCF